MYECDGNNEGSRVLLTRLKEAMDSERQDNAALMQDLHCELGEKKREVASLEMEINVLIEEKAHYKKIAKSLVRDLTALIICIVSGVFVAFMRGAWGVI